MKPAFYTDFKEVFMTFRQDFFEATKGNGCWNRILNWHGYRLATVGWHYPNSWKIVLDDSDFDTIADDRGDAHCKGFHTQRELFEYLKTVQN